jgi:hypothetical protein
MLNRKDSELHYRIELLEDLVKNKKIIHLGCCDHLPLIDSSIESNIWLHKRLTNAANECLGIDVNENAINYVQNKIGFKNVICCDIINDEIAMIENSHWDFLVMGEILEHIDSPVDFLRKIRLRYGSMIENAIITVPNAFCLNNFVNAFFGFEGINSDHRYWFTPYTLWKVIDRSGLKLNQMITCGMLSLGEMSRLSKKSQLFNHGADKISQRFPLLRDCIIAICGLDNE